MLPASHTGDDAGGFAEMGSGLDGYADTWRYLSWDLMTYRVFSVRRRRLMATPEQPGQLRLAALGLLHPVSRRRRFYQRMLGLAMRLGIDGLFAQRADDPLPDPGISNLLRELGSILDQPDLEAAVFWPPETSRGRVYLHLFDRRQRACRPVGFAKVSLDDINDKRLEHEATVLNELARKPSDALHVPAVLGRGQVAGHQVVVTEPLPPDARPIPARLHAFPAACVKAFAGEAKSIGPDEFPGLSWWPAYRQHLNGGGEAFDTQLRALVAGGVAVGRAHGDFGPSNIFETSGGLWVLDWEESAADAPMLADEITFDMGVNARRIARNPVAALRAFAQRNLRSADDARRGEILMALAFRAAVGPRDARLFIRHWETLS